MVPRCKPELREMLTSSLSPVVLISGLSFLVYYNSLWADFVFDDHRAILTNDDLDPEKTVLWGVFVNDFWGGHMSRSESHKSYRPLTVLTYRYLNHWFSGVEPFSYHLTNVLLHCAASVLFLFVCFKLLGTRKKWPSIYAATLFSVHSIHTEAVRGYTMQNNCLPATLSHYRRLQVLLGEQKLSRAHFSSSVSCSTCRLCREGVGGRWLLHDTPDGLFWFSVL